MNRTKNNSALRKRGGILDRSLNEFLDPELWLLLLLGALLVLFGA